MSGRYVAFIPVRDGSKSIPLKNVKRIAGRPLVHWAIDAAHRCEAIRTIVVSTDSEHIGRIPLDHGSEKIRVHRRSPETATDTASTESALLEYAAGSDAEDLILIQATSPLLTSQDLANGIRRYEYEALDSVLSVVRQKRFIWESARDGAAPLNYDPAHRPRRQEFDGYLVENGAFYITSRAQLLESHSRLGGRIGLVEMDEASYFELDEPSDWAAVEALLVGRVEGARTFDRMATDEADLSGIRAVFSDCDGVLTDGGMYYSESGDESKKFNTRDGMGFEMLRRAGLIIGIITSESVDLVKRRAAKLDVHEVHMGVRDKAAVIRSLCEKYSLSLDQVAYVGDDVLDVPAIEAVGLGCAVSDATIDARRAARYVTHSKGGCGALREVAELILSSSRNHQ